MLQPKVLQTLQLLDLRFQQEGLSRYQDLERDLDEASRRGDRRAEADLSLEMGFRLYSIATLSRTLAQAGQDTDSMPKADDALEPAIDMLNHSLEMALSIKDEKHEKLARNYLAKCYAESNQLDEALKQLKRLLEMCRMPEDALVAFDAAQLAGDCYLQLENDRAALVWYQQGLSIAQEIDDPFEVSVQLGKIASALSNLKRYDEALQHYERSRNILIEIGNDKGLQRKITIHRNLFNVAALPNLIAYNEERISHTRNAVGRDLLRELPERLGANALAVLTNRDVLLASSWPVFRELDTAVQAATAILSDLLDRTGETRESEANATDEASTLSNVGSLGRRHFDANLRDPEDPVTAARYLVQIDRSRRAAVHLREAEASTAGPGPFGGGTSRHVVYLRSFVASPRLPHFEVEPWGQVDLEELFACLLDRSPLIALGDFNIEQFGPGRARTSDENWRAVLRALAMEAQMLLVVPAQTEGTSWEIEWVVANKFLHKTCFVMPPPGTGQEAWWADNWAKLKEWSVRLGLNLPEYTPDGSIFRLSSEGLVDRMDFSVIYDSPDLHMTLLFRLLGRPNLSYDFLYGLQQSLEEEDRHERPVEEHVDDISVDDTSQEHLTLRKLEAERRFEFSNWHYDASQVPNSPGVLLLYETPFSLLWAEGVSDLHEALARHARGVASDFTRAFLHNKVLPTLETRAMEQLLERKLNMESVISFRVRQLVSYRFCVLPNAQARTRLVDLVWTGASKRGAPTLLRSR